MVRSKSEIRADLRREMARRRAAYADQSDRVMKRMGILTEEQWETGMRMYDDRSEYVKRMLDEAIASGEPFGRIDYPGGVDQYVADRKAGVI